MLYCGHIARVINKKWKWLTFGQVQVLHLLLSYSVWNLEKFQEDLNIDDLSPSIDYELLTQDVSLVIG